MWKCWNSPSLVKYTCEAHIFFNLRFKTHFFRGWDCDFTSQCRFWPAIFPQVRRPSRSRVEAQQRIQFKSQHSPRRFPSKERWVFKHPSEVGDSQFGKFQSPAICRGTIFVCCILLPVFFVLPTRRFSHRPIGPFAGAAEILEVDVKSTGELHIEGPQLNGGPETLESFRYLCSECFPKCSGRYKGGSPNLIFLVVIACHWLLGGASQGSGLYLQTSMSWCHDFIVSIWFWHILSWAMGNGKTGYYTCIYMYLYTFSLHLTLCWWSVQPPPHDGPI